jgi:hypothetical protein
VFSRTDTVTDSERFYETVLELLEDPDEAQEANELLEWWDRYVVFFCSVGFADFHCSTVFPNHSTNLIAPNLNSVLAKIRAKRAAAKAAEGGNNRSSSA